MRAEVKAEMTDWRYQAIDMANDLVIHPMTTGTQRLYSTGTASSIVGAMYLLMGILKKSLMVRASAIVRANWMVITAITDNQTR